VASQLNKTGAAWTAATFTEEIFSDIFSSLSGTGIFGNGVADHFVYYRENPAQLLPPQSSLFPEFHFFETG
jgi:hypothetical protein